MIEEIFTWLSSGIYENYWIALPASFGWGIMSVLLSPCHLTSIPLVVGFITSRGRVSVRVSFLISLLFSFGVLISIAVIGVITAALGRLMGDTGPMGNYIVAVVFFATGLYLLDLIKINWGAARFQQTFASGIWTALVLGLFFGAALGPCTFAFMAPVLGIVFQTAQTNFSAAAVLLLAFALGHCSVIISAGTLTGKLQKYLDWSAESKAMLWIRRVSGVMVIAGGVYFLYTA